MSNQSLEVACQKSFMPSILDKQARCLVLTIMPLVNDLRASDKARILFQWHHLASCFPEYIAWPALPVGFSACHHQVID